MLYHRLSNSNAFLATLYKSGCLTLLQLYFCMLYGLLVTLEV